MERVPSHVLSSAPKAGNHQRPQPKKPKGRMFLWRLRCYCLLKHNRVFSYPSLKRDTAVWHLSGPSPGRGRAINQRLCNTPRDVEMWPTALSPSMMDRKGKTAFLLWFEHPSPRFTQILPSQRTEGARKGLPFERKHRKSYLRRLRAYQEVQGNKRGLFGAIMQMYTFLS